MKLEPTLDRVAVRREPKQEVTKGGIIIPDEAKKESEYGTVVAVGPGGFNADGTRRKMGVKEGDVILFCDYHTTLAENNIVLVDEEDVLAIVKE